MEKRIYLSPPHMCGEELAFITKAFEANWIAPVGPDIVAFEEAVCRYTGAAGAVALASGSAGIHLALLECGVRPGDTVLCSTFTFAGSAFPIEYCQAVPYFVDSNEQTWNMDPGLLEQGIQQVLNDGGRPKAVILVHLYGIPADIEPIARICKNYGVALIEDAAESLGARCGDCQSGTIGDLGIYSFNGNKIITTSGGGMVVSNNLDALEKIRFWSTQSRDPAPHYQHTQIGFNYRMSNIVAAIGRGQMCALSDRIVKKKALYDWYRSLFDGVAGVELMPGNPQGNFWLTCITIDCSVAGFSNEQLRLAFESANIESRPLWKPMHLQPVFAHCQSRLNGVSQRLFAQGLCLPSGTAMNEADFGRIETVIRQVCN